MTDGAKTNRIPLAKRGFKSNFFHTRVNGAAFNATMIGGRYIGGGTRESWGIGKVHPNDAHEIVILLVVTSELINGEKYQLTAEPGPVNIYLAPSTDSEWAYPATSGYALLVHDQAGMVVSGEFAFDMHADGQVFAVTQGALYVGPSVS